MNPPRKLPFALQSGESVILFTRRHWLYLWSKLVTGFVAAIVPVAILTVIVAMTAGLGSLAGRLVLALDALYLLYWIIRGYFTWYSYQHDIWVVTNQRVVDGTRPHWFRSHIASADLTDIEDIAVDRHGVLQTMFDYGEVRCQTAGEMLNFLLAGIPHPSQVLATIDASRDVARRQLASVR